MLIADREQRSDAVVMYGILARATLERFESPLSKEPTRDVYFTNLIRLLEMYKFDALKQIQTQGVLEARPLASEKLDFEDDNTDLVRKALDLSILAIRPTEPKFEVTTLLQSVFKMLRDLGIDKARENIEQDDLKATKDFLAEFRKHLQAQS